MSAVIVFLGVVVVLVVSVIIVAFILLILTVLVLRGISEVYKYYDERINEDSL